VLDTTTAKELAELLDSFPRHYHRDFSRVRESAKRWLDVDGAVPKELAELLVAALKSWGAGMRKAPEVRPPIEVTSVLQDEGVVTALRELHRFDLDSLTLDADGRPLVGGRRHLADQERIEGSVFAALRTTDRLFIGNTSVTYPSKALMLLTGRFIGLDSNVRAGISRADEPGFRETRFPMPADPFDRSARRMYRVLWLTGDWLARHRDVVHDALAHSTAPHRLRDLDAPARVVDVMLFMQGVRDA
jgi:hypothetical protein